MGSKLVVGPEKHDLGQVDHSSTHLSLRLVADLNHEPLVVTRWHSVRIARLLLIQCEIILAQEVKAALIATFA